LLAYAPAHSENPVLLAKAAALLHQPSDAQSHNDHMHLRIYCPRADRLYGCVDRGPQRWRKKLAKYFAPPVRSGDPFGLFDSRARFAEVGVVARLASLGRDLGLRWP